MEERLLCKCVLCLKENPDGVLLPLNTHNRHRRKQQEFSKREDFAENSEFRTENIPQDFEFQPEDIYQEKDAELRIGDIDKSNQEESFDLNCELEEDSDTESFSIDEEDKVYYEEDDESDDDYNDSDDDTMQIDDINDETNIPNKVLEGLKLLHLKSLYNFTESAFDDIMKIFTTNNISLYKVKKYLKDVTGLVPVFYDMCENSCICYTGVYEEAQNCPMCNSSRFDGKRKAKKVMPYLSIIDRLRMQFGDENRANELLYRHEYLINKCDDDLDDIFDGEIYKELVDKSFFNDKRDIVFTVSCDGYQIFKQKTDDCWLFLMINNNLHPSSRVKKENLLVPFLIPGPNQPKDFNTFLRPFINEMKELESKRISYKLIYYTK